MKKFLPLAALLIGVALLVLSVLLPVLATGQNTSIIGGADTPTFAFLFMKSYLWLAIAGVCLVIAALFWPKK